MNRGLLNKLLTKQKMEPIFYSKTSLRDVKKGLRLSLQDCERKGRWCETAAKKSGPGPIWAHAQDKSSVESISPIIALKLRFMQNN